MGFDITAADPILKDHYQGPVREQLNNATFLLSRLRKNDQNFEGRRAYMPLHKGRNVGIGARKIGGTLPTAGNQQYDKALFDPVYLYGRIELAGPAISRTKGNIGSFIRAVSSELKGVMIDLKQDLNRQLWHDGSSCLTQVNEATTDATQTVQGTKFLAPSMRVQVMSTVTTPGTIKNTGNEAISSVDAAAKTVTFPSTLAAATTVTDIIVREGARDSNTGVNGVPTEMWGLEAAISHLDPDGLATGLTSNFGEIDRSSAAGAFYKANRVHNSGVQRALSLDLMQEAVDLCDIASDEVPGAILTNHAIKRRYAALLVADKRYPAGGDITLDGGYKALEFNGISLVADKDASLTKTPDVLNRLYFLSMGSLEMQVLEDWQFMQKDGAILSRVANKDAYEATVFAYMNLGCDRPNANCVLEDILES
jgi:hypothetical protein